MHDITLNEYIKKFLDNDESNLFSNDYDYPQPFNDTETRKRIAWIMRVKYRSLIVDDMLTIENDGGDIARLFVKNGLITQKRNIERIYALMNEETPILSNNDFTETHTKIYGEKNTTNVTGARKSTSTDGNQKSTTNTSATSYDDITPKLTDTVENTIDAVTNTSNTDESTDTSKQDTYTDSVMIKRQGLLDADIPDYLFKELKACEFDYEKYFAKILADILTYPIFL